MIKKISPFVVSLPFTAFLFLLLAVSLAVATFVENSYGTAVAHTVIYNARWLEILWVLLAINLVCNLKQYNFFSSRKISLGLFHFAFLIMILGAAVTRYFGYGGKMHIREGQNAFHMLSSDDYFYAGYGIEDKDSKVCFSENFPKQFSAKFSDGGHKVKVKSVGFIHNAQKRAVASDSGKPIVDFVLALPDGRGMQPFSIQKNDSVSYPGFTAGFNASGKKIINFFQQKGKLFMTSCLMLEETTMAVRERMSFSPGDTIAVRPMFLYGMGNFRFLIRKYLPKARFSAVESPVETNIDAVLVQIDYCDSSFVVPVFGHSGTAADTIEVVLGNGSLKLAYGAKPLTLPFGIFLKDFQIKHYPGSKSPSSFASQVTLTDTARGVKKDFRIFMNNTLTYRGYKFFQSSYDNDEHGTVLSVNHDFAGTWISYVGYALLFLGIILSLVNKNSHFRQLARKLKAGQAKFIILFFVFCGMGSQAFAQNIPNGKIPNIDNQIVNEFSGLWVQGVDGRIEPVSTLSGEIIRKITGSSTFRGKKADEMMLSMMTYPKAWRSKPIIKIKNKTLASSLGAKNKHISIQSLFDSRGSYKISNAVQSAYAKSPATRNKLEKEYIYLDERANICFMVFRGRLLHLFPSENSRIRWHSAGESVQGYDNADSLLIQNGLEEIIQAVADGKKSEATEKLVSIKNFQQKYGAKILPSGARKEVEVLYNKINPFKRIFPFYLILGFLLLGIFFINLFREKPLPDTIHLSLWGLIFLLFVVHSTGLAMRWYIAGHAPWSNGYESIVYVAWTTVLAGFLFGRKSPIIIGAASFLSGIALFVAHLNWMNPEVTNLVPVLKSYWLTLHVAVITSSYSFLGLSMFTGIFVMVLLIMRNKNNAGRISFLIERLTLVNEMSATVGLYFLTIGTFLGAIWANESWGRYWGWDPKETWALITIVVYAFVVHMRLIPPLKGVFTFNFASAVSFLSVIMTYFGVNYYLTGLHSYGSGFAIGNNPLVLICIFILSGIIVWAYVKDLKFRKENQH